MQLIRNALARITGRHAPQDNDQRRVQVAAVAHYMAGQASSLRGAWEVTTEFDNPALAGEARMLQAGAAAADTMSELLLAAVTGDKENFRHHFNAFVDDAIAAGIVTV